MFVCHAPRADRRRDDARASGANARAGRVRHGLRAGHRAHHGVADGHQFPEVRAGRRVHFAVRQRPGGHALSNRRPVLPLQEPEPAAPGPGHERPVDRQPIHRTGHVRTVLQASRVLHHQAENDEQTATQDTAVLQEVLARLNDDPPEAVTRANSLSVDLPVSVIIVILYVMQNVNIIVLGPKSLHRLGLDRHRTCI